MNHQSRLQTYIVLVIGEQVIRDGAQPGYLICFDSTLLETNHTIESTES